LNLLPVILYSGDLYRKTQPSATMPLNTGEPISNATRIVIAQQTIYHDAKRPSHVLLPMIPASMFKAAE